MANSALPGLPESFKHCFVLLRAPRGHERHGRWWSTCRGLRSLLSIVWACSRQLADTNGPRGGGRPPRVVRSTVLEPAPCNGYAPAAKPATPVSASGQRLKRAVDFVMKHEHASHGTYVWRGSQRTSQASDDWKPLCFGAPGARFEGLCAPGASGVFWALFGLALGSSRTRTACAVVVDRQGSFAAPFREPAPCNGYAPAAKPATPLSAACQRLKRPADFVVKNEHASHGAYVWRSSQRASPRPRSETSDSEASGCASRSQE